MTAGNRVVEFIRSLSPGTLVVDFDPAELIIGKQDVEAAMRSLGSQVVHFRARDAVRDLSRGQGLEVQLGRGSLDLPPLLGILEENGYQGFLTVDRQPNTDGVAQCEQSLRYLENVFG